MKKRIFAAIVACIMLVAMTATACGKPADSGDAAAPAGSTPAQSGAADQSDWIDLDLSFATFLTEDNPCQGIMTAIIENVQKEMPNNTVTLTTYGNGTLLGGADIYDGVVEGTADIGYVQTDLLADRMPLSQLPPIAVFDYNGACVATQVWRDFVKEVQPEEFDDVVVIQCQSGGPQAFLMGSSPVEKMADFKGKQIAAGASRAATITAYGGTPVSAVNAEYYESLRSGLVDGVFTMFGAGAYTNLDDVVDYATLTPLGTSVYIFAMNKEKFNSMPPSQQEAFMRGCDAAYDDYTIWYQESGLYGQRVIDFSKSVTTSYIEGAFLEDAKKLGQPILEDYLKTLEEKGIENPQQYVDKLNELGAKYNAEFTFDNYKAIFNDLATITDAPTDIIQGQRPPASM